jgi:hypothetical protein
MMKLKLTKSKEFKQHSVLTSIIIPRHQPACEMMVPGVGRIRTAQMHANFHLVASLPKAKAEISANPVIKKQEIVHVR